MKMRITKDKKKDPNYDYNRIKEYIERANVSESNKKVLRQYMIVLHTGIGVKKALKLDSIRSSLGSIIKFGELIDKDFLECDKQDIMSYIGKLKEENKAQTTLSLYSILIRQFFIWLHRENNLCDDEEIPQIVKWIKGTKVRKKLDYTKLITPEEVKKMIRCADNLRDKALISSLYESGTRRGEILGVRIKDIQFDKHGCQVYVNGKTGGRNIYLIDSVPYIQNWYENHPFNDDPEAFFFISFATNYYGQCLSKAHIGSHIKTIAKRAGIKKHIHPHLFRHSRATHLGNQYNFTERDLKLYLGWTETSDMPNTYLHYNVEAVFDKLKRIRGLSTEEESKEELKQKEMLKPIICSRCSKKNPATAKYCNCGQVLDKKEALNIEEMKNKAINQAMEEFMKIAQDSERMKRFEEFKEQVNVS